MVAIPFQSLVLEDYGGKIKLPGGDAGGAEKLARVQICRLAPGAEPGKRSIGSFHLAGVRRQPSQYSEPYLRRAEGAETLQHSGAMRLYGTAVR
jgi:hypothetical protein